MDVARCSLHVSVLSLKGLLGLLGGARFEIYALTPTHFSQLALSLFSPLVFRLVRFFVLLPPQTQTHQLEDKRSCNAKKLSPAFISYKGLQ
jgi:hypothetical protein